MTVRVDVEPDLLRWAAERAGWDRETVERRAPRFEAWITGTARPTLKQLEAFAKATHTPFGLLFLPRPPVEEVPIPDMRTIGNDDIAAPSANLLDTIYTCQNRQDWYRGYVEEHGIDSPDFVGAARASDPAEQVAAQIRQRLDFEVADRRGLAGPSAALRALIDRVESLGVLVMVSGIVGSDTHRRLDPDEFRGFALADPVAPLIFVNGSDTKAAQLFTLIHELAHVWLGGSALSDAAPTATSGVTDELWCNRVAAEVLVPRSVLHDEFNGHADQIEITRLARLFRASTLVVIKRLFDITLLDWADYQQVYNDERARLLSFIRDTKRSDGGDFYNTQPLRLSRRFTRSVIGSTVEGTTAYRDAYQLLGTKTHATFEKLAERVGVA
ncbi:ImmA/IrrE family metallo-endopeptidase [Gordonia phthalatica]|uniref:DNA-binding protein n=1 Tax=Gordonia phthalatica TaxID=1136941 RepID=A0A0N9NDW1_9ACTN|nr:ImmA/IrrE family metallo-endopeptidase [Gordonia phthalatica]ALG85899.1 DNA-binding protein [Gordonia phthalatica]